MPANGSTSRFRSAAMRGPKRSRKPCAFSPRTARATPVARRLWSTAASARDAGRCAMNKFGIGQAVRRVEDQRFTTGAGQFVADLPLPRHALVRRIDVGAAKAAPGVLCVLIGADADIDKVGGIPPFFMPDSWGGPPGFSTTRAVLNADRVRCIGDRVAFVVAETEAQARDATELVTVD